MSQQRINPQRIKIHYSYTVEEAAMCVGAHKNTIRTWIKDGLETIDGKRPTLITGRCLKQYIKEKQKKRRCPCKPGTIYCLKCRKAREPAMDMVDYVPATPSAGDLIALCNTCETTMYRKVQKANIEFVMPNILITVREPERSIEGISSPSLNCDFENGAETHD